MKKNDNGQISQGKPQATVTEVSGKQIISDKLPVNKNGHDLTKEHRGSQEVATGVNKKPNVSSRRVEANRRNALKSTGPRTPFGKKMVARNAVKHGFFPEGY